MNPPRCERLTCSPEPRIWKCSFFSGNPLPEPRKRELFQTMPLIDHLTADNILIPLTATTREGAIRELIAAAAFDRARLSDESVCRLVLERESQVSTGIGNGVAVPHAKFDRADDISIVLGVSDQGIDFNSTDGKPVTLLFLLLPNRSATRVHLELLREAALLARSAELIRLLHQCRTPGEILDTLRQSRP